MAGGAVATEKRRRRWSLRHIKVEVNLLVAKIGLLFSREPPLKPTPKNRVRKAQRIARAEYRIIQAEAPRNLAPYVARAYPISRTVGTPVYSVFGMDENGLPRNVIGETVVGLASQTRLRAIREGDAWTALAAAIVEQVVVDSAKKQDDTTGSVRWN
jgi:hypothetical protein